METFRNFIRSIYASRYRLTYMAIAVLIAAAFLYRLNSLTPGPHSEELALYSQIKSLGAESFFNNIVFLPYLVLSKLVHLVLPLSMLSLRLTSVLFAVSLVAMLYYVLYIWHTRRIATLGLILLLSSSWFIGLARFGTTDIMYAWGVMAALSAMTMIFHHARHTLARSLLMLVAGALIGLSLYVPYAIYMYALAVLIAYKSLPRLINELNLRELLILTLTVGLVASPLIIGLIDDPRSALTLLGLPRSGIPPSTLIVLDHMKDLFSSVFWKFEGSWALTVGNLPLLSIFGAGLAALGMYHYEQHLSNLRTHLIVGMFFALFLLLAIDYRPEKVAATLPLIYILIAMGAVTLLTQWYRIFPKNPFARSIGLVVVALFISLSIAYHNQRYFVAWARSPETKLAFADDVVKIEGALHPHTAEGVSSVLLLTSPAQAKRLSPWLSDSFSNEVHVSTLGAGELAPAADAIIVGPDQTTDDFKVDWSDYQLESEISTTSQLEPEVYRLYLKN